MIVTGDDTKYHIKTGRTVCEQDCSYQKFYLGKKIQFPDRYLVRILDSQFEDFRYYKWVKGGWTK